MSPTSYQAALPRVKMAGLGGFEPPNDGVKVRCLTTWRQPITLGDEIVIKPEKSGKDFVEDWCSIVKKKLSEPIDLKKLKEDYYEQVDEDVLL